MVESRREDNRHTGTRSVMWRDEEVQESGYRPWTVGETRLRSYETIRQDRVQNTTDGL